MKIGVYAICRDEARNVVAWLGGVLAEEGVDEVTVLDTGSTDGTLAALHERAAVDARLRVHEARVIPWRFDVARNQALSLVANEIDVVLSLDLDERMSSDWPRYVRQQWQAQHNRGFYRYGWSTRHAFSNGDIHRRAGAQWIGPTHEDLVLTGGEVRVDLSGITMTHHQEPGRGRHERDLVLLELGCAERPTDPRASWYYARELSFAGRRNAAAEEALRMLTLPAGWRPERSMAMILIGDACAAGGRVEAADAWYQRASAESPELREPHVRRAILHAAAADRWRALAAVAAAERIASPPSYYLCDPTVWDASYIRTLRDGIRKAAA